jgi:hypothetical protein
MSKNQARRRGCSEVSLFKTFYGRYAGTEGNLKTEVIDVKLLEVPDPRNINDDIAGRLEDALVSMCGRDVGRMVEESLMDCHSYRRAIELAERPLELSIELRRSDRRALDDAAFELLGVNDAFDREKMVNRLYEETALHFRAVRVTEIQKMEDRASGGKSRLVVTDLAADAWDALDEVDMNPLRDWVSARISGTTETFHIPSDRPVLLDESDLFEDATVYFGARRRMHVGCSSRGQAELLARIARLGVTGEINLPEVEADCRVLLEELNQRQAIVEIRLQELAASRSGNVDTKDQVFGLLLRWFILGKSSTTEKGGLSQV